MRGEDTEKQSIEDPYVPAFQEALQAYARAVWETLGEKQDSDMRSMLQTPERNKDIEYVAPADATIDGLARKASQHMAALLGDDGYLDRDVTYGLSAFIKLVAGIKARHLNA